MNYFLTLMFLFIIGSLLGYIIELFFRRFVSMKKWINPGFLHGPYLPIYGFGITFFYIFSNINYVNETLSYAKYINPIISILIMGVLMTLLELIGGIIFIKGMHIKLWDYSNLKGNYKGIICPLFSLIWTACSAIYYFGVNPFLDPVVNFFNDNIYISFFVGIILGLMFFDFIISYNLANKIKKVCKENNVVLHLEKLRISARENKMKSKKENKLINNDVAVEVRDYINKVKNSLNDKVYKSIYIDSELAKEQKALKKQKQNKNN